MSKILDLKNLESILKKRKKKKIIHCHGVFDLLHVGHIYYFEEAKKLGDILIVTITEDKYVNKGEGRPFFSEKYRADSIAALEFVDYVYINRSDTAEKIIEKIKPSYYVKGPDYSNLEEDISANIFKEKKAVESVGGKLIFTKSETFSSSNLINKAFSNLNSEQKKFLETIKKTFTIQQINKYIDSLTELKVINIGESILDEYVYCETIGKSGKDPFLVSKKINSETYLGGILAVANHISSFVKTVNIFTYLGDTKNNKSFITKNLKGNVELNYVEKDNSPTILKTRFIDTYTNSKMSGIYSINDEDLDKKSEKILSTKISSATKKNDLALIVDYGHGLITDAIINAIYKHKLFLAVNFQINSFNRGFYDLKKYKKADFLCIHEGELRQNFRRKDEDIKILVRKLAKELSCSYITITRGKNGALVFYKNKFFEAPAFANNIVDRVGAGDTMLSLLALCFSKDIPVELSLLFASIAAAENISSQGSKKTMDQLSLKKSITSLLK